MKICPSCKKVKNIFGTFGVFMGFLIFITMTLIGLWNPIVALMLGTMGFVITNLIGFINYANNAEKNLKK